MRLEVPEYEGVRGYFKAHSCSLVQQFAGLPLPAAMATAAGMSFPGPRHLPPAVGWLRPVFETMLDGLYPRACRSCDHPLPSQTPRAGLAAWFCAGCLAEVEPNGPPCCAVCGEAYDGPMTGPFQCWNCQGRRIAFDFAISAYKASGPLREVIHRFKYNRDISLRGLLTDALLPVLDDPRLAAEDLSRWLLVPVPLHYLRQVLREFNQSWELCRTLAQATGIPAAQVLRRARRTRTQAGLDRQHRLENLRGIFTLRPARPWARLPVLQGRSVLLVDDVLTTGATAHECARVLKEQGGAARVVVITAARA